MGLHFTVYESEMAPEGYKETARQHPRANPVIPEKHALQSSTRDHTHQYKETQNPPNKTFTSTVTEKLAPAYNAVSDATAMITSKIQNISGSAPAQTPAPAQTSSPASAPATAERSPKFYDAPVSALAKAPETAEDTSPGKQIWDKGVSVKEYLMQKLEPGDDERALSQVISDAMSPGRAPGDAGVVEKVRGAVTSLLRKEDSSSSRVTRSEKNSPSQIPPLSTNPQEGKRVRDPFVSMEAASTAMFIPFLLITFFFCCSYGGREPWKSTSDQLTVAKKVRVAPVSRRQGITRLR